MAKVCSNCKLEKPLTEFYIRLSGKAYSWCKGCSAERAREWAARNPEKAKKTRNAWLKANPESFYDSCKAWRVRNPEKRAEQMRRYLFKNPCARLARNLRVRISLALKSNSKSARTLELLGCSIDELKSWLSGWFQPGMSWENYGDWHIDHRRPCASFNLADPEQQKRCFHYLNLQPLWAKDNLSKGAGIRTI